MSEADTREKLADTVTVVERQGLVILGTPERPIAALGPEAARLLGEALCRKAYRASFGDDPAENVNIVTEQVRSKLVTRLALVFRGLLEKGKTPEYIAKESLDIVLREIS